MARKQGRHFLLALEVLLLCVVQTRLLVDLLAGVQADEVVVRRAVLLVYEVDVVGRHNLDSHLSSELEYSLIADLLLIVNLQRKPRNLRLVEHHLKVVIVPEDTPVPFDRLSRLVHLSCDDVLRDLARKACGAADQVLVVLLNDLVRDSRLAVVKAFDVPQRHNLHQVLVPFEVLCQQDEVVI